WAVPSIPSAGNVVGTGREPKGFVSNRRRLLAKSAFRPPRMEIRDRGSLLYTYRPIPANPMTVALLLLLVVVTFLIGPLVAGPEGLWPLGGLCFLPVALVLGAIALFKPSKTLVFENGIEISLPLWRVIRGRFARRAEPMVRTARTFSDAQVLELQAQAHVPLIPVSRVFLAFLLPPAILAAILVALFVVRVTLTTPIVAAAFVVALIPP